MYKYFLVFFSPSGYVLYSTYKFKQFFTQTHENISFRFWVELCISINFKKYIFKFHIEMELIYTKILGKLFQNIKRI